MDKKVYEEPEITVIRFDSGCPCDILTESLSSGEIEEITVPIDGFDQTRNDGFRPDEPVELFR